MSLKNNINKIILRETEIEKLLVNTSNLKQAELVELSQINFAIIFRNYIFIISKITGFKRIV